MSVTQADIARRAGVSQRTVSNVVNGLTSVSPDKMERVNAAILELGYSPSLAARSLRVGRSGVLQLVVPELDVPYFAELARGVIKCAEDQGYAVMVRQTLGDRDRERDALEGSAAEYAEGTILSAVGPIEELMANRAFRSPVVLIGERSGMGVVDHIGIDNAAAAEVATNHLLQSGRRRVAFIGAHPDSSLRMASLRYSGYKQALERAGVTVDSHLVVQTGSYHRGNGESAMATLLDSDALPDGVFCATDLLALGAMKAIHERGLTMPGDIAVVGFDGLEEGRYSVPPLSTIEPDKGHIARASVETLLMRIRERESGMSRSDLQDLEVPFSLIARSSSS